MISQYKPSILNYLFNSINSIVMIINGIIMVPIYFRYMSISTYGAWLASGNLVAMIGLLESGFSGVITQKMATAISGGDRQEYLILAGSNIMTAFVMAFSIFALGSCMIPFVANVVNADSEWAKDITIAYTISLFSSAIALLVSFFGAFPQVWQETKVVGVINAFVNIFAILVMVICLVSGLGVISLAIGYISRSCANLVLQGLWILRHWKRREVEKPIFCIKKTINLVKECVYPFFARVSNVFMGQSQSLMLAAFMTPSAAAIYDITSKIFVCAYGFVSMANGSFFALLSLVFSRNDKNELNRVVGNIIQYFTVIVVAVLIFGFCFSKTVINLWVGLDKFGGDYLLFIIGISLLVNQYKSFFNNLLFTSGNIKHSSIIDICSLVGYIGLLFISIKVLGIYAIPTSMLLTNLVFGVWYIKMLLNNTQIEIITITSFIVKNVLVVIPFVFIYLIVDVNPNDYVCQAVLFLVYVAFFFMIILCINPTVKLQLKKIIYKNGK